MRTTHNTPPMQCSNAAQWAAVGKFTVDRYEINTRNIRKHVSVCVFLNRLQHFAAGRPQKAHFAAIPLAMAAVSTSHGTGAYAPMAELRDVQKIRRGHIDASHAQQKTCNTEILCNVTSKEHACVQLHCYVVRMIP